MKAVSVFIFAVTMLVFSGISVLAQVPAATPDESLRTFEVRLPVSTIPFALKEVIGHVGSMPDTRRTLRSISARPGSRIRPT